MKPQKHQTHLLFLDDFQKTTKGVTVREKHRNKAEKNYLKTPKLVLKEHRCSTVCQAGTNPLQSVKL